jgi:steroid delta-isomerase-like uncharacterized protein
MNATDNPNTSIAGQFYSEVINKGNTALMESILSKDFTDHNAAPEQPQGIPGLKQFLSMVSTAFPDVQVQIEQTIDAGDSVVVRLSISGTQTGILLGNIPPSGRHAIWTGIDILKFKNGKITDRWSQRDLLGMMRQIGAIR